MEICLADCSRNGEHCRESNIILQFIAEILPLLKDFLSSLAIVHGNLACRNILVGEGKNIKVSNFVMPTQSGKNVIDSKSLRWMALESMLHNKFTTSSDVWSYGIVLWELSTMGKYSSRTNRLLSYCLLARGHCPDYHVRCRLFMYPVQVPFLTLLYLMKSWPLF